jgi:uncharacterized protein YjiS (DUF1127 family)
LRHRNRANLHELRQATPARGSFSPRRLGKVFVRKKAAKTIFHINYQLLKSCNSATLQRNIIAFQIAGDSYFPVVRFTGNTRARPATGPAEKEERGTTMFASIVRFIRDWKRYNNSVRELSRLGDRDLADIGISRSDIERVAWSSAKRK